MTKSTRAGLNQLGPPPRVPTNTTGYMTRNERTASFMAHWNKWRPRSHLPFDHPVMVLIENKRAQKAVMKMNSSPKAAAQKNRATPSLPVLKFMEGDAS